MPEKSRSIKHLERIDGAEFVRVHLDDGKVVKALGAVRLRRAKIGLLEKRDDKSIVIADIVRPATPGIKKMLSLTMVGSPDSQRPFLTGLGNLRVDY